MSNVNFLIATPSIHIGEYIGKIVTAYYNCNVYIARDGWTAYSIVKKQDIDVAIVSLSLPRLSGYEIIKTIREKEQQKNTKCILSDNKTDCDPFYYVYIIGIYGGTLESLPPVTLKKVVEIGVDDIITEPISSIEILVMKVQTAMRIASFQKRNASLFREINEKGNMDPLCIIPNRMAVLNQLDKKICESIIKKSAVGVFMIDIDYFKSVNDTYGHQTGDIVLREFAQTIKKKCCRSTDIIGRYGGEEFLAITPISGYDEDSFEKVAGVVANKILTSVRELSVKSLDGKTIKVTCSVGGTVVFPFKLVKDDINEFCLSIDKIRKSIIQVADMALYDAKKGGRNRFVYKSFQP